MQKFYVTYGIGSNLAGNYSVIEAEDCVEAREKIHKVTKGKHAFFYSAAQFANTALKHGLREIALQPQTMLDENHD